VSRLEQLAAGLPMSVADATEEDSLAIFGQDPQTYDDPTIASEDLWEETINRVMKEGLGWGTEMDMSQVVRRGAKGVGGLIEFVRYFVESRGVDENLFEGKLRHIMEEMDRR
jgi:hypothetical protein